MVRPAKNLVCLGGSLPRKSGSLASFDSSVPHGTSVIPNRLRNSAKSVELVWPSSLKSKMDAPRPKKVRHGLAVGVAEKMVVLGAKSFSGENQSGLGRS